MNDTVVLTALITVQKLYNMLPWTTKPVLSVNFSKLRFILHLKAENISFPLMCGLLGDTTI